MKGFPNQIADLPKLSRGLECLVRLVESGANPKDDGVFGEALVRAGVLGTGHTPMPVEDYISQQVRKPRDRQSFRISARGLRELYRYLGLIDDTHDVVRVTDEGRKAAGFGGGPLDEISIRFWRRVISNFDHFGGDAEASHPYQVLLHLIAKQPGISRAKCALALEAKNDSQEELQRIVDLSGLAEDEIRRRIGASQSNWDNAKKSSRDLRSN
jgi:hypothetical protein